MSESSGAMQVGYVPVVNTALLCSAELCPLLNDHCNFQSQLSRLQLTCLVNLRTNLQDQAEWMKHREEQNETELNRMGQIGPDFTKQHQT